MLLIVGVFVGAGVFMRARRVLVCIHYAFIWGNGEMGFRGNGKLWEWEIGLMRHLFNELMCY